MANGITKSEVKKRLGYFAIGFFGAYMASPLRDWIDTRFTVSPVVVGLVGFVLVLYFFDF